MADLNPIDAAKVARSTGNLFAVLADHSYLAPMRDGQYRLPEPLPDGLRRSVLRRDRFTCCDCRQAWSPDRTDLFLQVDHVVPVAAGGSDRTDNLRTLSEVPDISPLCRRAGGPLQFVLEASVTTAPGLARRVRRPLRVRSTGPL